MGLRPCWLMTWSKHSTYTHEHANVSLNILDEKKENLYFHGWRRHALFPALQIFMRFLFCENNRTRRRAFTKPPRQSFSSSCRKENWKNNLHDFAIQTDGMSKAPSSSMNIQQQQQEEHALNPFHLHSAIHPSHPSDKNISAADFKIWLGAAFFYEFPPKEPAPYAWVFRPGLSQAYLSR